MTSPTVLLCDDSRALLMVTSKLLSDNGFDVVGTVADGVAALEQYQALKPDVVLLDLVMPRCDGKEALRNILDFDDNAKVVILSSLGSQQDIEDCLAMGAKSYLQKPIDAEVMNRVLREIVG